MNQKNSINKYINSIPFKKRDTQLLEEVIYEFPTFINKFPQKIITKEICITCINLDPLSFIGIPSKFKTVETFCLAFDHGFINILNFMPINKLIPLNVLHILNNLP